MRSDKGERGKSNCLTLVQRAVGWCKAVKADSEIQSAGL